MQLTNKWTIVWRTSGEVGGQELLLAEELADDAGERDENVHVGGYMEERLMAERAAQHGQTTGVWKKHKMSVNLDTVNENNNFSKI